MFLIYWLDCVVNRFVDFVSGRGNLLEDLNFVRKEIVILKIVYLFG